MVAIDQYTLLAACVSLTYLIREHIHTNIIRAHLPKVFEAIAFISAIEGFLDVKASV